MHGEAEFLEFFEGTRVALHRFLLRAAGNDRPLAEDIMQETYLRFLTSTGRRLDPAEGRRYLFRIAGNLLRDHWRKQRRSESWAGEEMERIPQPERGDLAPAESMLRRLPPAQRAILWLAYVEGYDHREIGSMLGLKHASIRVLLFRARKKLAGLLQGEER